MIGQVLSQAKGGRPLPPTRAEAEHVDHVRKQVDRLCWTGILLGLAFTPRFAHLTTTQRGLYLVSLACSADSVATLIAPGPPRRYL